MIVLSFGRRQFSSSVCIRLFLTFIFLNTVKNSVHSSRHTPTDTFFTLQVLADIRADKDQANDGLSSALLILYLDSARNLPVGSIELTPVSAFLTWKLLLCSDTIYIT